MRLREYARWYVCSGTSSVKVYYPSKPTLTNFLKQTPSLSGSLTGGTTHVQQSHYSTTNTSRLRGSVHQLLNSSYTAATILEFRQTLHESLRNASVDEKLRNTNILFRQRMLIIQESVHH